MVIVVSAENITTTKKQIEKSRGIDKFKQIYKKDLLFYVIINININSNVIVFIKIIEIIKVLIK